MPFSLASSRAPLDARRDSGPVRGLHHSPHLLPPLARRRYRCCCFCCGWHSGSQLSRRRAALALGALLLLLSLVLWSSDGVAVAGPALQRWTYRINKWLVESGVDGKAHRPTWAVNRKRWLAHSFALDVGLGNHMFVVASLVGLARTHSETHVPLLAGPNETVACDRRIFPALAGRAGLVACTSDPTLYTRFQFETQVEKSVLLDAQLQTFVHTHPNANLVLNGYLQSFRYFQAVRDELRAHLRFADAVYEEAMRMIVDALERWGHRDLRRLARVQLVGAHVRRGDYVSAWGLVGNRSPTADYYRAASRVLEALCGQQVSRRRSKHCYTFEPIHYPHREQEAATHLKSIVLVHLSGVLRGVLGRARVGARQLAAGAARAHGDRRGR